MNLAGTIRRLARASYTVTRFAQGAYENGRFVRGAPTQFTIRALIQPTRGQDLLRLPEGERTRELVTIYTTDELHTANAPGGAAADRVTWRGETYEVQGVERWDEIAGFWKAIAAKVPVTTG